MNVDSPLESIKSGIAIEFELQHFESAWLQLELVVVIVGIDLIDVVYFLGFPFYHLFYFNN